MSVSVQTQRVVYTGNGATHTFSFAFTIESTSQITVVKADTAGTETTLTLGTDYTVTLATGGTGSVTLVTESANATTQAVELVPTPLPTGYKLALISNLPLTQEKVFADNTPFYQSQIEGAVDKNCRLVQQIEEKISRAVIVSPTSSETPAQLLASIYTARDSAVSSASNASGYANNASNSATQAGTYATSASNSANSASNSANSASNSANTAQQYVSQYASLTATASTLSAGSSATATFTPSTGVLALGIPQGIQGETGATGATGDSGVYIGSTAPSDTSKYFWIDTGTTQATSFELNAGSKQLIGTSAGSLTWDGSNVITNANKATSSSLGVVKVDGTTITASSDGTITAVVSGISWGSITGTLSNQTDLQTALDAKGTYSKPNSGIPASDLAESYYLASNPNGYTANTGTITGITMNGTSMGTSGVVNLGTVITAHQDISGKQDVLTAGTGISIVGNVISVSFGNAESESY